MTDLADRCIFVAQRFLQVLMECVPAVRKREHVLIFFHLNWLAIVLIFLAEPAQSASEVNPIRFARGASSAEVQGAVIRGERALYSIEGRRGQSLTLRITASEMNAVFQIFAPGATPDTRDSILEVSGSALPGAAEGDDAMQWSGRLPQTVQYLLVVGATRGNASYRLTVGIR
jgi:hypothetical protein